MHKLWSLLFGVIAFLCVLLFLVAPAAGWWLPRNVSSFGGDVDILFYVILAITAFFFVLTEAMLVYNMFAFGHEPGRRSPFVHGHHKLEVIWTLVPGVLLIIIAVVQIKTWENIKYQSKMPKPDGSVLQIVVQARQWEWRTRYPSPAQLVDWEANPDGAVQYSKVASYPYEDYQQVDEVHGVNEIHCWMGKPGSNDGKVLIHLKTRDVIHSFFLPHLRLKQDALPGKSIPVWFQANDYNTARNPATKRWEDGFDPKTGKWGQDDCVWDLACAEFCGARHSMMKGRLYVHKDKADFLEWLKWAQKEQDRRTLPSEPGPTVAR